MKKEKEFEELTIQKLKEKIENEAGEFNYFVDIENFKGDEDGKDEKPTGTSKN